MSALGGFLRLRLRAAYFANLERGLNARQIVENCAFETIEGDHTIAKAIFAYEGEAHAQELGKLNVSEIPRWGFFSSRHIFTFHKYAAGVLPPLALCPV
jgi:hypothetical protein